MEQDAGDILYYLCLEELQMSGIPDNDKVFTTFIEEYCKGAKYSFTEFFSNVSENADNLEERYKSLLLKILAPRSVLRSSGLERPQGCPAEGFICCFTPCNHLRYGQGIKLEMLRNARIIALNDEGDDEEFQDYVTKFWNPVGHELMKKKVYLTNIKDANSCFLVPRLLVPVRELPSDMKEQIREVRPGLAPIVDLLFICGEHFRRKVQKKRKRDDEDVRRRNCPLMDSVPNFLKNVEDFKFDKLKSEKVDGTATKHLIKVWNGKSYDQDFRVYTLTPERYHRLRNSLKKALAEFLKVFGQKRSSLKEALEWGAAIVKKNRGKNVNMDVVDISDNESSEDDEDGEEKEDEEGAEEERPSPMNEQAAADLESSEEEDEDNERNSAPGNFEAALKKTKEELAEVLGNVLMSSELMTFCGDKMAQIEIIHGRLDTAQSEIERITGLLSIQKDANKQANNTIEKHVATINLLTTEKDEQQKTIERQKLKIEELKASLELSKNEAAGCKREAAEKLEMSIKFERLNNMLREKNQLLRKQLLNEEEIKELEADLSQSLATSSPAAASRRGSLEAERTLPVLENQNNVLQEAMTENGIQNMDVQPLMPQPQDAPGGNLRMSEEGYILRTYPDFSPMMP